MSRKGVYTLSERISFHEGEIVTAPGPYPPNEPPALVACGPGNRYCMEATLEQIAEVFFRVKEAEWVGGSYDISYIKIVPPNGDEVTVTVTVTAPTSQPTERVYEITAGQDHVYRGFFDQAGDIVGEEEYFKPAYSGVNGEQFADIDDDERAMWLDKTSNFEVELSDSYGEALTYIIYLAGESSGTWKTSKSKWDKGGVTAFSFWSTRHSQSVSANHFSSSGAESVAFTHGSVKFTGNIGVVKLNPTDSMYAASNRFFIEVGFDSATIDATPTAGLKSEKYSTGAPEACFYIIRLANNVEIKCQLYSFNASGTIGNFSDFIHDAKEWWPYAQGSPDSPIWNSATGLKL